MGEQTFADEQAVQGLAGAAALQGGDDRIEAEDRADEQGVGGGAEHGRGDRADGEQGSEGVFEFLAHLPGQFGQSSGRSGELLHHPERTVGDDSMLRLLPFGCGQPCEHLIGFQCVPGHQRYRRSRVPAPGPPACHHPAREAEQGRRPHR